MTTRYGTHHFISRAAALAYYALQDIDSRGVDEKIKAGEIAFGAPVAPEGQRVTIEPSEGRYFIEEDPDAPTWENQLRHARRVLKEKGREALDNPHGMTGRKCGCGTCFTCAAAQVVAEHDAVQQGYAVLNQDALKQQICDALAVWIRKRPGLNPRDYFNTFDRGRILADGRAAHRAAQRELGRDKRDAEILLATVRNCEAIGAEALLEASKRAFAGRLEIKVTDVMSEPLPIPPGKILERAPAYVASQKVEIEYTPGQDGTTEYRAAAAAVLAKAIWENAIVKDSTGDKLRQHFRKEFGSALQRRWFN